MDVPENGENPLPDFIPPREIPRRRLIHSGIANQKFRRAVLEASAEIATEFTEHYWKEVVNGNKSGAVGGNTKPENPDQPQPPPPLPPPTSNQSLKQRFVFYLNASGRYLVLREHLRQAVSHIVQQRCLNLRPSGFQSHRDFQTLLHDMYNYLIDEMHESLNRTKLQEGDPLDPQPPKILCDLEAESPASMKEVGSKTLLRELLFYSEESFVQGDFDNCHRIHLQRICRSREDSTCWLDFALMWLSRGDDRMAEIAVREALRRDPMNIYALVIGGIIAVRHSDSRGITVLGAALDMKPLSPELLVILALANIAIGDAEEADYFFRKAAYLHRTLTGQSMDDLDELLTKLAKSVGASPNLGEMEAERRSLSTQKPAADEESLQAEMEMEGEEEHEEPQDEGQGPPKKGRRKSVKKEAKRKSKEGRTSVSEEIPGKKSSKDVERKSSMDGAGDAKEKRGSRKPTAEKVVEILYAGEEEGEGQEHEVIEGDFYTRKTSLSREVEEGPLDALPHVRVPHPKIDFIPAISDLIVEDSILPPLRPSLLVPWNVTDVSDKMKTLLGMPTDTPNTAMSGMGDSSTDIASGSAIQSEYDQIIEEQDSEPQPRRMSKRGSKDDSKKKGKRESLKRRSLETQTEAVVVVEVATEPMVSVAEEGKVRVSLKNGKDPEMEELFLSSEAMQGKEGAAAENNGDGSLPVFVNRLGSELIWAGHLLLKLRMFDMLDGVLTRELYSTGKRSIQFLYLRAMSLYLRKLHKDALSVIDEAIQIDQDNPVLWILRGHCFYETGEMDEASKNYETALRLPVGKENRHLLYLRFGSLALDNGNYDTAKRVFLYGIQKYPTPYLWLAIGNTCYTMGNLDEAEAAFAEANRLDNTNPITWAHLALINLACDRQALAEQSYKWAMRFGLKKGKILEEIKKLQVEKGFGDPSFPRIPNCIPHDYYVRRLGRQKPFEVYRDALLHETPTLGKKRFDNTERENALRDKLTVKPTSEEVGTGDDQANTESVGVGTPPMSADEGKDVSAQVSATLLPTETEGSGPSKPSSAKLKKVKSKKSKKKLKKTKSKRQKGEGAGDGAAPAARGNYTNRPSNPAEGQRRKSPGKQELSRDSSTNTNTRGILKGSRASYF